MEAAQILDRLKEPGRLPVETIRAAQADRMAVAPIFLQAVERYLSEGGNRDAQNVLFFIFHLLGEWREKAAYRPLAQLLRRPRDELDLIVGGGVTETTHRVMAAVFDGDPRPLYDVILDPEADEFIRSRMLEVIAMVTLRGEMPRAEAVRFLHACYCDLNPQEECWVWQGWENAIAMLGVAELRPLVEQIFTRGFISPGWLSFEDFEDDLRQAIDDPDELARRSRGEYSLFGDTIEELSSWYRSNRKDQKRAERDTSFLDILLSRGVPATNPWREVGRNDPCPCGSGKKFKKCCLAAQSDPPSLQAM